MTRRLQKETTGWLRQIKGKLAKVKGKWQNCDIISGFARQHSESGVSRKFCVSFELWRHQQGGDRWNDYVETMNHSMVLTWEMIDLLGLLDLLEGWWFHVLPPGGTEIRNEIYIWCNIAQHCLKCISYTPPVGASFSHQSKTRVAENKITNQFHRIICDFQSSSIVGPVHLAHLLTMAGVMLDSFHLSCFLSSSVSWLADISLWSMKLTGIAWNT